MEHAHINPTINQDEFLLLVMEYGQKFLNKAIDEVISEVTKQDPYNRMWLMIRKEIMSPSPKVCTQFLKTVTPMISTFLQKQSLPLGEKALDMVLRAPTLVQMIHAYPNSKSERTSLSSVPCVEVNLNDLLNSFDWFMNDWVKQAESYVDLHQTLEKRLHTDLPIHKPFRR